LTSYLSGLLALLAVLLVSCGSGGHISENTSARGYNPGVGPFDSRGNYVERWADDKSKGTWWRKSVVSGSSGTSPATAAKPPVVAATTTPSARSATSSSAPKPKPPVGSSATASTPKPSSKPAVKTTPKSKAPIRYTVKKGDTLWAISRKYKTTVTAIQRANGIKGTNLKIGRTLIIPRY